MGAEVLQIRVNMGLNHYSWLVVSFFVVHMSPCELYRLYVSPNYIKLLYIYMCVFQLCLMNNHNWLIVMEGEVSLFLHDMSWDDPIEPTERLRVQLKESQRGFAHSHAYIQIKSPKNIEDTWDILRPQKSSMTQVTQVMVVACSKVLALPLFAVSWALFNVWRVAFRQAGCLRIWTKKTWRNGKKRRVSPCSSKQKVVLG